MCRRGNRLQILIPWREDLCPREIKRPTSSEERHVGYFRSTVRFA